MRTRQRLFIVCVSAFIAASYAESRALLGAPNGGRDSSSSRWSAGRDGSARPMIRSAGQSRAESYRSRPQFRETAPRPTPSFHADRAPVLSSPARSLSSELRSAPRIVAPSAPVRVERSAPSAPIRLAPSTPNAPRPSATPARDVPVNRAAIPAPVQRIAPPPSLATARPSPAPTGERPVAAPMPNLAVPGVSSPSARSASPDNVSRAPAPSFFTRLTPSSPSRMPAPSAHRMPAAAERPISAGGGPAAPAVRNDSAAGRLGVPTRVIRDTAIPAPVSVVSTARPGDARRSHERPGREGFHFGGRHGEGPGFADRHPRPVHVWHRPPVYPPRPYCPPRPRWGFSFGFYCGRPLYYPPPIVGVPGPVFVEPAYVIPSPTIVAPTAVVAAPPAVVEQPAGAYTEAPPTGYGYGSPAVAAGSAGQAPAEGEAQPLVPPPPEQQPSPPPAGREQPLLVPPSSSAQPSASPEAPAAEAQAPSAAVQTPAAAPTSEAATAQGQGASADQARIEEEFGKRMEEGAAAFARGEFDKARHAFVLAILAMPDNVDAKLAYAITQFAIGDYHVAAILLRQVIPAHPEVVYSDFDLRERYEKKEKLTRQVETLRAYIKAHPGDADAMLVLGFVQHFSGQRDEAKRTFAEVLKVSPKEAVASVFLNPPPLQVAATQPAASRPADAPGTDKE